MHKIQKLFQFVQDNLGKDNSVIGLSGLKKQTEYVFITVPKEFKKTCIQQVNNNYLLF